MKKDKTNSDDKIFIVETVSTFKIRYAIKGKSLEHAMDTVALEEAEELDQEFLTETIFGGREVTEKEFLSKEINNKNMDLYPHIWTKKRKLQMIHTIDYE